MKALEISHLANAYEKSFKETSKKVSKELAQGRGICRLRPASPATGSARETNFSSSRLGLIAGFNFPRTRSFTQHDLIKMRATYFGRLIGRFDSRRRGKTELCAAVVETLTRQMIGNLKRVIYRTCQFSIRLLKDKKYANRFKKVAFG